MGEQFATCCMCGRSSPVFVHEFRVGNLPGPPTRTVRATMYFAASGERPGEVKPYCSPRCASDDLAPAQPIEEAA